MKSFLTLLLLVGAFSVQAQNSDYDLKHYNLKRGLAIQGYDPVAYFTENKAVEGKSSIQHSANGVKYYFASEANKKLFKSYSLLLGSCQFPTLGFVVERVSKAKCLLCL